jgi:hypothetical protein
MPDGGGSCCPLAAADASGYLCNDADSLAGGAPLFQGKAKCLNAAEIASTRNDDLVVISQCAASYPACRFRSPGSGCPHTPGVLCEEKKDEWGEPECKCLGSKPVPDETGLLICSTTCEQLGMKAGDCAGRSWPPCGDTLDGEP